MSESDRELPTFLIGFLKIARGLIISGWLLLLWTFGAPPLIGIALIMILAGCITIGIQYMRLKELKKGLMMFLPGILSLGIWPGTQATKIIRAYPKIKY